MIFLRLEKDKNVINEHNHKVVKVGVKNVVHCLHETGRRSHWTKIHDLELIMPIPSGEGSLLVIFLSNSNLVIPRLQVNLRENLGSLQLIEQVLDTRKWVLVLDSHMVETPVIKHIRQV
jgi:hypothetical protein